MATVCAGCLSLMDAGVPIAAPVAGIAMGLIKEEGRIAILSDILGDEDHLGDMDFKVCGTGKGSRPSRWTSRSPASIRQILTDALEQAAAAGSTSSPRWPRRSRQPRPTSPSTRRRSPPSASVSRIKDVIGPGGKVIKDIIARTGASIDIEDDGSVAIASASSESVDQAIKMIRALTQEAEVGKTYLGTVRRIMEFGAFVEIFPGTDGSCTSPTSPAPRVKKVEDVLKEGDEVLVKSSRWTGAGRSASAQGGAGRARRTRAAQGGDGRQQQKA